MYAPITIPNPPAGFHYSPVVLYQGTPPDRLGSVTITVQLIVYTTPTTTVETTAIVGADGSIQIVWPLDWYPLPGTTIQVIYYWPDGTQTVTEGTLNYTPDFQGGT